MKLLQLIKSNPNKPVPSRKRRLLNVLIIIGIIIAAFDFIGMGNIWYTVKWASCGQRPVGVYISYPDGWDRFMKVEIVETGFLIANQTPVPLSRMGGVELYCTTEEAQARVSSLRVGNSN